MKNITPDGKQAEVLALPAKGHLVVLGTAGSGKTTMALLRAIQLSSRPGDEKVLLVTFNGALVDYMRNIANEVPSKLNVENYHKFARGYLNYRAKMPRWNGIIESAEKLRLITDAVSVLKDQYPEESTFRRPIEFFVDEITFIERFGFTDLDSYYDAERIGRSSANIKRDNRKWIYAVYIKYLELREKSGRKYDWDDLAMYVYQEMLNDSAPRRYTHIIVDEGQDFSPMMIKSLVKAVADGGSFSFFGDVAQQIYGSRLSWRDSGINTDRIWRFNVNYRNPATIVDFATDITKSKYWRQDTDMVETNVKIAQGPKPVLIKFLDREKETFWVVERAVAAGKNSSVVIVCRNRTDIETFRRRLAEKGCSAIVINKDTAGFPNVKAVYLSTFHAVKGLEFENVFIPYLSGDKLPDADVVGKALTKSDAYADEIKLLYVAVTRSKYGLYMSFCEELSPLFPAESQHYDYYDEEALN